jgi:hypothetical protein
MIGGAVGPFEVHTSRIITPLPLPRCRAIGLWPHAVRKWLQRSVITVMQ